MTGALLGIVVFVAMVLEGVWLWAIKGPDFGVTALVIPTLFAIVLIARARRRLVGVRS